MQRIQIAAEPIEQGGRGCAHDSRYIVWCARRHRVGTRRCAFRAPTPPFAPSSCQLRDGNDHIAG